MTLVFVLLVLVGTILLSIGIIYGMKPETKYSRGWAIMFTIGLILIGIGWTGGATIQDIEENATQQECQYEYNYCPYCGEQLSGTKEKK